MKTIKSPPSLPFPSLPFPSLPFPSLLVASLVLPLAMLAVNAPQAGAADPGMQPLTIPNGVVSIEDGVVSVHLTPPEVKQLDPGQVALDPAGHWTAEKILNARPMEAPAVDLTSLSNDSAAPALRSPRPAGDLSNAVVGSSVMTVSSTEPVSTVDPASTAIDLRSSDPSLAASPERLAAALGQIAANETARTGRLIAQNDVGVGESCSATVLAGSNGSLIVTAAHCVFPPPNKAEPMTSFLFAPGYWDGVVPYGLWAASDYYVPIEWTNGCVVNPDACDAAADQAVLSVKSWNDWIAEAFGIPYTRHKLTDMVGGQGYTVGASPTQSDVRIWGYPADEGFDGELSYYCDGNTTPLTLPVAPYALMTNCVMPGGGSGGPWLINRDGPDQGTMITVSSGAITWAGWVVAVPFGDPFSKTLLRAQLAHLLDDFTWP